MTKIFVVPLRVLVLDHTASLGGAELALVRLLRCVRSEVSVQVVLFQDGPLKAELESAGLLVNVLPLANSIAGVHRHELARVRGAIKAAPKFVRFVGKLRDVIRQTEPDLIVANSLKAAVFSAFASLITRKQWVWHLHDRLSEDYLPKWLVIALRVMARFGPKAIVVNSLATRNTLPKSVARKATIAYPGIELERDGFQPNFDRTTVGIVGRISPTKGQIEFLEAAAVVATIHPEIRFRIVGAALFGEHDYESLLRTRAMEIGISDKLTFIGWAEDPIAEMRDMRVLVHASPVPEPFGQVIIEGMLARIPVVASAAGGVLEIMGLPPDFRFERDGVVRTSVGIAVRPGDATALAKAIDWVLKNPTEVAEMTENAHLRVVRDFTVGVAARRVLQCWRQTAS